MSNRKGKKGGPSQGDQETDTSKLLASATALISEEASEFLPKNQQADFLKKNLDKAERKAERAIELDANLAAAHYALGTVRSRTNRRPLAAQSFVRAMELTSGADDDPASWSEIWAESASHAYEMLSACPGEPRPAWWKDDAALLTLSERAATLLPESTLAHRWRADVLSAFAYASAFASASASASASAASSASAPSTSSASSTTTAHRSAAQLRLASTHFRRRLR